MLIPIQEKKFKYIKPVLLLIGFIAFVGILSVSFWYVNNCIDFKYEVSTINFPKNVVNIYHPIYTINNKIVFSYKNTDDNETYWAVSDDDGNNLKNIYKGDIKNHYQSNGIRIMPFNDNKRLLLGDYVMECTPDLDNADIEKTKVLLVEYPEKVLNDPSTLFVWSEIIISPDNNVIAWTTLHMTSGAINFIGKLERNDATETYTISNVKIISSLTFAEKNSDGYITVTPYIKGGEIKQFAYGGEKISFAGATHEGLSRSVLQEVYEDKVVGLSHEPGYEETTIVSPDGKLGLVMTTRFSPKTNFAILGLVNRSYSALNLANYIQSCYMYAVQGARNSREGNIGPALIEIEKGINEIDYHGYDLHDETDNQAWVYNSPMSWRQDSTSGIWLECHRITREYRVRKVKISNYDFGDPIPTKEIDISKIPYALDLSALDNLPSAKINGTILGYGNSTSSTLTIYSDSVSSKAEYVNFSTDGKNFANGVEEYRLNSETGEASYTGHLSVDGPEPGQMNFTVVLSKDFKLLKDKSSGFATYRGKTVYVSDMIE